MPNRLLRFLGVVIVAGVAGFVGSSFSGGNAAPGREGSFVDTITSRGELRVGIAPAPPISGTQPDGTLGGPSVVPLQLLATQLGVRLTPVAAEWGTIVSGLQAGRFDVAVNLDATLERATAIQFSRALYEAPAVFVVPAESRFHSAAEVLDAGPIAVTQGAGYVATIERLGAQLSLVDTIPNALTMVKAGRAVAEFVDLPSAVGQAQADASVKIIAPDPAIYRAEAAYGLPADIDARSRQIIDIAIAETQLSGELERAFADAGYRTVDQLGDLAR